jgi:two-component system chemotaxis sensor kinase CheA
LADALELPNRRRHAQPEHVHILLVRYAAERLAFAVDEILEEQEVVMKPLGRQLQRVRNIAGAATLGTGQAVAILDVPDLMRSAARVAAMSGVPAPVAEVQAKKANVLVTEDSITSRALLKNILEAAGYTVATAADGADAFASLKLNRYDLVVSDVEMPRMNGFDLTAKIRADPALRELPVVLVTALGTPEDRERGADVGANAYIVKSSFDQKNLLEVVRRLV